MKNKKNIITKKQFEKVLEKVDSGDHPDFGDPAIDISKLPCINKPEKEKVTLLFEKAVAEKLRKIAKKYGVSNSALTNDILKKAL